jgi:precorrin-6B methylase 1
MMPGLSAPARGAAQPGVDMKPGRLVVVGTGIQLGRHVTERALSEVRHADVVFCLADSFALATIRELRPDTIGLHGYYGETKDRRLTYREMEAAILKAVYAGQNVCAVFYGHPGVFADVPHGVMRKARERGYAVRMEPGISAEACLYADLGIDPGKRGVQSCEATRFLVYDHRADASMLLILWQVALTGDLSCVGFETRPDRLKVLVDKLSRWYPADTEAILYEAAQLPIQPFRAERLPLTELPEAAFREYTTLVIPPVEPMTPDRESLAALGYDESDLG